MRFSQNEYVWDRFWDAPAIIVGLRPGEGVPYVIAELDQRNRSLARLAERTEDQLSRYINVKLPEAEALALTRHVIEPLDEKAAIGRINGQLLRRGIWGRKDAPAQT
jgi:hypothetical protein